MYGWRLQVFYLEASPRWARWWVVTIAAELQISHMDNPFPALPDRRLKRWRTDENFSFQQPKQIFPKYHVVHSQNENKAVRAISPFLVSKTLTEAIGPGYKVTKMGSGDLLLELRDKTQYDNLSKLTAFGDIPVSVGPHRSMNTVRGVISDDDLLELSESELLEGWQDQNVVKVQRITIRRDDKQIPTKHIIITFGNSNLPDSIETGYCKLRVRPYIPNPRRCFKCQRFGHGSQSCRGRATCAKCASKEHLSESCTSAARCANCEGDHPAYSRSCPSWKKEKEIIELKVKFNLSFQEARKRFSLHNQSSPSYADVSRRGAAPHLPAPARVTRSVTAVAPSAPPAGVACAAPPPPKEGQQTPEPAGPKAAASAVRPEAAANVPAVQAPSTTSEEVMDTNSTTPASQTPKERRNSLERAKKEKARITGPRKGPVT